MRLEDTSRGLDVKRGFGGLADIEFLTGWLQLRHGHAHPAVRVPSLMEALAALVAAGRLGPVRHEKLRSAYQMLRKVESRLRIAYNRPLDRIPESPDERDLLARRLGYRGGRQRPGQVLVEELTYFTRLTRELFEEMIREGRDDR
jgi:glutamate-ammonia-ligase adenylyltransferase